MRDGSRAVRRAFAVALLSALAIGVVGNLLTLAQVPSFWIQAIYGAIILGSLMVARFASGQSQE